MLALSVLDGALVVFQDQICGVGEGVGFLADSNETLGVNPRGLEQAARPRVAAFSVGREGFRLWVEAVFLRVVSEGWAGIRLSSSSIDLPLEIACGWWSRAPRSNHSSSGSLRVSRS
jgi:hypothetical protein